MLFDCKHEDSELYIDTDEEELHVKMLCHCAKEYVKVEDPDSIPERVNRFKDRVFAPLQHDMSVFLKVNEFRLEHAVKYGNLSKESDLHDALSSSITLTTELIGVCDLLLRDDVARIEDVFTGVMMIGTLHEHLMDGDDITLRSVAYSCAEFGNARKLNGSINWRSSLLPFQGYYKSESDFPPKETTCSSK